MFENLISIITEGISLSEGDKTLLSSVEKTPSLEYFKVNNDFSNLLSFHEQSKRDVQFDKVSLVRLIQSILLGSFNANHPHFKLCQSFLSNSSSYNIFKHLISDFNEFPHVIIIDTLVLLCKFNINYLSDEENLFSIMNIINNHHNDEYLCLFCALLLFWVRLDLVYDNSSTIPRSFPNKIIEQFDNSLYSPLVLSRYLSIDGSQYITKCLKSYDVFSILKDKWLLFIDKYFCKPSIIYCSEQIFYILCIFLNLYQKSLSSKLLDQRIIPLASCLLKYDSNQFLRFIKVFNIYGQRPNICSFCSILSISSKSCSNSHNCDYIFRQFLNVDGRNESLLRQFFNQLKNSLSEIVCPEVSDISVYSFSLLKKFCKYLSFNNFERFLECFSSFFEESYGQRDKFICFTSFLYEFISNKYFSNLSLECMKSSSRFYPGELEEFFNNFIVSDSPDYSHLKQILDLDSRNIYTFSSICVNILSYHFNYSFDNGSSIQFCLFFVRDYFPISVFKRYDSEKHRWKSLRFLIECAQDLCYCDHRQISVLENDIDFTRSLISIILSSCSIFESKRSYQSDSPFNRFDEDHLKLVYEFVSVCLFFLEYLISYNLTKESNLSRLNLTFFEENSSFFSVLVSLLELTHPLSSILREYSLRIIDLMCSIASRQFHISVDAF